MIWLSSFLAAVSLLAVFKAPAKPFWFVAIGVTEAGHWLVLGSLAIAIVAWRISKRWGPSSWLALVAALFFISPLVRAIQIARHMPSHLSIAWGYGVPRYGASAPPRHRPLSLPDLVKGVSSPRVQIDTFPYATVHHKTLELDLYRPVQSIEATPVILVVHGGSWQSGHRGELPDLNKYLAARGYAVATIDYRLAPGAVFPAQREDVFSAIAYLQRRAEELNLDARRVVILGRSAGGQIALSAAYTPKRPEIKGAIVFYGPNDLTWAYSIPTNPLIMDSRKVIETYLGGPPTQIPGSYESASPLRWVNHATPPTLMIHGERDELVWSQHEVRLSERLAQEGRPYYYLRLPWATHGCDAVFSGPCGQMSTYAVERFLAAVLPPLSDEPVVKQKTSGRTYG